MSYTFTKQAQILFDALIKKRIEANAEYWDGHKHIDIAILPAKLFIELDGLHHFTNPKQIMADFKRDHYSDGDDFVTIRLPNAIVEEHLNEIVNALEIVINNRLINHS